MINIVSKNKVSKKVTTKNIAITGITAALYVVMTLAIAPLAYGAVQFRFSELMVLFVYINPAFAPGLVLGCAIANCFSPLGIVDVIFGTMGTLCTVIAISKTKNLFVATLWPTVFCIFVSIELYFISGLPFLATTATVMLGEFAVVTCIGYPLFKYILKNTKFIELLK